jgi:chromosomal replication initiation ATPase DnaA
MSFETDCMPSVISVLREAENKIKGITGHTVIVSVDACEVRVEIKEVLRQVICSYFGYSWKEICSPCRTREVSDAMHVFMFLCVEFGITRTEAGRYCGRDHSTSIAAIKKIKGYYDIGDSLCDKIEDIKTIIEKQTVNEKI